MALGFTSNSNAFLDDHRPYYIVNYWDTVYTPESAGIEFSLFTLIDGVAFESTVGQVPTTQTRATMEGQLNNQAVMTSVLGYISSVHATGVTPSVYHHWGSGGLPGITLPKATVLKYRGDVKVATGVGGVTLIFGGQGRIQVYRNGTEIGFGKVSEPIASPDLRTLDSFQTQGGYYVLEDVEFAVGDDIEIYYWHHGQEWGGFFCKVLDDITDIAGNPGYDSKTIRTLLRDAPILSASFMGVEAGGADLSPTTLPYIESMTIDSNRDTIGTATVTVTLTTNDQPNGFQWDEDTRSLIDNDTSISFKEDRRVELVAGYAKPSDLKDANGEIAAAEIFTRFTGHITKIQLAGDFKTAVLECKNFAEKMIQAYDENFPDRLSYHSAGYILREGGHEPMFPIPAFDAWPIETAIAEYCYRSGIDSQYLGKDPLDVDPTFGRRDAFTVTSQEQRFLRKLFKARHLGDDTTVIPLENNSAYGNIGVLKKDFLPDDAEYLYPPEITRRCYDQAVEKAEHYGYNFSFDPLGRVYLRAGNNPDEFWRVQNIEDGTAAIDSPQLLGLTTVTGIVAGDKVKEASAIGGNFMAQTTADIFTVVVEGYFSRLDLYAGVGLIPGGNNGGVLDFSVEVWNGATYDAPSITGSISTFLEGSEDAHFYDGVLRTDGTNATVFKIFSGPFERYRMTLSKSATNGGVDPADPTSPGGPADFRLNAISVFYQDPETNMFPVSFATDTNVFEMKATSSKEDLRNHVIVVGSRKGVLTDSAKLSGSITNPNNLDHEFNVSVAADPASIYDATAGNFTGNKRIAVIFDDKVADSDFARWIALTTLFRYRDPRYKIPVDTIAIPMLEVGDAIAVHEAAQNTINTVAWVQSFQETWNPDEASVSITTSSFPDIPSFQPRLTPDIDGDFGGQPANNVRITYTNLMGDGTKVVNADLEDPTMVFGADNTVALAASPQALTTTLMPETMWLKGKSSNLVITQTRGVVNHPYRRFYHISSWNASNFPTLTHDLQEGDGNVNAYGASYYDMPTGGVASWDLRYKSFNARSGPNPFYDPYASELGHLISLKFDAIASGRYRISVWDARRSGGIETPVAWITNPQGSPDDPEDHWLYLDQQTDVEFTWDGVDNIGLWNRKQSADYAQRLSGSFGEEPLAVGAGFYAWNDLSTDLLTQIGDNVAANYRSTGDIREIDYPYFTVGRYSKFYVKIETLNPVLMQIDAEAGIALGTPRIVSTDGGLNTVDAGNSTAAIYVWTHLGEPSQVDIGVEDWDPNNDQLGGEWEPGLDSDFGTLLDASGHPAIIRNGKPVKYTFVPRPRAGTLFGDDPNLTNARLTRQVHLQTTIFDQFWTFFGTPWEGIREGNTHELKKRITSRMYHNNTHTVELQDSTFRSGQDINTFEWIFQPEFFKLDFGLGIKEALRYGDYEQLEAIPGHNSRNIVGQDTAFMTLAFMNYLFYFSAYTLDRSGRRQWMINREFIDKSKIVTSTWLGASFATKPEYAVDHATRNATDYLKRSIFVREWRDDDWTQNNGGDITATRTPLSPHNDTHPGTGGALDVDEVKWLQFPITDLDPHEDTSLLMSAVGSDHLDTWMQQYRTSGRQVNRDVRETNSLNVVDPVISPTGFSNFILPHRFQDWQFERGDQGATAWYKPSPKRDFHPYWTNGMSNWHTPFTSYYIATDMDDFTYGGTWSGLGIAIDNLPFHSLVTSPSTNIVNPLRDIKSQDRVFGYAFQHTQAEVAGTPWPLRGARIEQSVTDWAAEDIRADLQYAFNYEREDLLARYEHFRGVWGRGPYSKKDDTAAEYDDPDNPRSGTTQKVQPSGVYLLNLGRYKDFVVASPGVVSSGDLQHWTRGINDWYYIRFRHEYVWYGDRHFPVSGLGTALYGFLGREYTQLDKEQTPWALQGAGSELSSVFFDPGAWVGFKDDVADANDAHVEGWTASPILRWGEASYKGGLGFVTTGGRRAKRRNSLSTFNQGTVTSPYASGGFQFLDTDLSPNNIGSNESASGGYSDYFFLNADARWIVRNIFDMGKNDWGTLRIAVGPELDQSRELHMNLVLPNNLQS